MAEDILVPIMVVGMLFIGLPWLIFHYVTRWKTAATITDEDEDLLDELHRMARRLDQRMDTIERIMAADNPDWRTAALPQSTARTGAALEDLEQRLEQPPIAERNA